MSTEMVRAILEGKKTMTRRVITKQNSIIGEGGDWAKLDFDGKEILSDSLKQLFKNSPKGSMGYAIEQDGFKCKPWVDNSYENWKYLHVAYDWEKQGVIYRVYPKWEVGDRLWVRETWRILGRGRTLSGDYELEVQYKADMFRQWFIVNKAIFDKYTFNDDGWGVNSRWRPSIFMPRWASRINLEVTAVRPERLQDITEEDAIAEGFTMMHGITAGGGMGLASARHSFMLGWNKLNAKRGYGWDANCWVLCTSFKQVNIND